jgi:molybdate transport system ATP-binding protein
MLEVTFRHAFPGLSLDVCFNAPPGITVLFGRSGSGKTTIVNAVAGLLAPDQGRIVVQDRKLFDSAVRLNLPPHLRRAPYVFQEARLFPHLTVRQNLSYGRWFTRATAPDFATIVEMLGIGPLLNRRPAALSGGEKQRVALGRALLAGPEILLMDEPLAALDEARKAEILPYIERLRDTGGPRVLYVTHALAEVARLATTLVVVENGVTIAHGPAQDLLSDPTHAPQLGLRDAGSILSARLVAQEADGLSRLETAAGPLWLPQVDAPLGSALRIRIAAQDVILSRQMPQGLSALNILPATVSALRLGGGPGALVQLALGGEHLLVRLTRRSAEALALEPGAQVFAIVKSVAVAQSDIFSPIPQAPHDAEP